MKNNKRNNQITGNAGLYYVCYQLSLQGWNVMPTSRNARGVDIIAYDSKCKKRIALQVKALWKRPAVPLGATVKNLIGDCWIIVSDIRKEKPSVSVMTPKQVQRNAVRNEGKNGKVSYWLPRTEYEKFQRGLAENWLDLPAATGR